MQITSFENTQCSTEDLLHLSFKLKLLIHKECVYYGGTAFSLSWHMDMKGENKDIQNKPLVVYFYISMLCRLNYSDKFPQP